MVLGSQSPVAAQQGPWSWWGSTCWAVCPRVTLVAPMGPSLMFTDNMSLLRLLRLAMMHGGPLHGSGLGMGRAGHGHCLYGSVQQHVRHVCLPAKRLIL